MWEEVSILIAGVVFFLGAAYRDHHFKKLRIEFEHKRKIIFKEAEESALEYVSGQIARAKQDAEQVDKAKKRIEELVNSNNKVVVETNRRFKRNLESMIRYHEKLSELINQLLQFDDIHGEQEAHLIEFIEQLTYQHTALEDYYFSLFGEHFTFEKEIKRFKDSGLN